MSMTELLRRMVRQQTVRPPALPTNIYGAVAGESPPLQAGAPQTWLWTQSAGRALPSLDEFYSSVTTAGLDAREEQGVDGVVIVRSPAQQVHLLRGVMTVPTHMAVPMSVATGSSAAEFLVMVGGVLQRRATDSVELNLALERGQHLIEVLAFSDTLGIAVPPTLEISASLEKLQAPQWREVETGYIDAPNGVTTVALSWYNDLRAGGWRLFRREQDDLGLVLTLGEANARGEFGLTLEGDQTPLLSAGEEISAGQESMGTVVDASYDVLTDSTSVRVRLELTRTKVNADWQGRPAGSGRFQELTRIGRTGSQSIVHWDDLQVKVGTVYEYKLQAYGLLDRLSFSPFSATEYIRAGDIIPPGPITFIPPYPRKDGRVVSARFITPDDEDYAGVRVYFQRHLVSGDVGTLTAEYLLDPSASWTTNQWAGHFLLVSGAALPSGGAYLIASNDATHLYPDGGIYELPSGGQAVPYQIRFESVVVTDFGKPSAEDQFSFDVIMSGGQVVSGDYVFRSFDYTGNELQAAPRWNFNPLLGDIGVPQPLIGPIMGEHLAADSSPSDGVPDGMVYVPIRFDQYTKEVWIYAAESATQPVPTPNVNDDNRRSAVVVRPPGDWAASGEWQTIHRIATTPNWYRRIYCYAIGWDGFKADPVIAEVQATSTYGSPLPPSNLEATAMPAPQSGYAMSWNTPGDSFSLLMRNQIVVFVSDSGMGQQFQDTGLPAGIPYDYTVQQYMNGRVSQQITTATATGNPATDSSSSLAPLVWAFGAPYTLNGTYGAGLGGVKIWVLDPNTHIDGDHLYLVVHMSTADASGVYTVPAVVDLGVASGTIPPAERYEYTLEGPAGETRQFYVRLMRVRAGVTAYTEPTASSTAMFSLTTPTPGLNAVADELFNEPIIRLTLTNAGTLGTDVYVSVNGSAFELGVTLAPNENNWIWSASYGDLYCFYVQARGPYGVSLPSATKCATVNP